MSVAPRRSLPDPQQSFGASAKLVTHIRSTLLMSSQATLREQGLFELYASYLHGDVRHEILQLGAPCWLPLRLGLAHYEACQQLALDEEQVVEIAKSVAMHREGSFLGIALNLARGAGVTPLTVSRQLPRMWSRAFTGGAVQCVELGPKEVRIEAHGWPCAHIPYCRYAFRGLCLGVAKLLSREAYVKVLPQRIEDSVSLQVSWV
ncbi:MAG TPA: hypothetical protein VFZ61_34980 [Polyangiales bacterium]